MAIEPDNKQISIARQCELIGLSRPGYYYRSKGETDLNLELMNLLDEQYTKTPFYGVDKMTAWLNRQGYQVNHKRVRRLLRKMGLMAVYPGPRLSISGESHKKYPYLLRDFAIVRPNQVWCTDITYLRMDKGFSYLVAIMDWYSRYLLSWAVSITLEADFCVYALRLALNNAQPDIFNTDQGVQFTSELFTGELLANDIRISMDGRGRVFDNIFVERLWRTVKYEEVYLHNYRTPVDAREQLRKYFKFYNTERIHEALDYNTPHEIYFDKCGSLKS